MALNVELSQFYPIDDEACRTVQNGIHTNLMFPIGVPYHPQNLLVPEPIHSQNFTKISSKFLQNPTDNPITLQSLMNSMAQSTG